MRKGRSSSAVRRALVSVLATALVGGPAVIARGAAPAPCTARRPGGEWSTYGADLHGTQRQDAERTIGVANVAGLERAWITDDTGYQSPPPIVAGGCVFINTGGHIEALDLDTGAPVWQSTGADTSGTFAVTVVDGRVHVGLYNGGKPKAAAFDVTDGHLLWTSDEI
jgi:outer membrane protein assembly factor BamB